jgi:hypothetical protein
MSISREDDGASDDRRPPASEIEWLGDDDPDFCHYCRGEGWGIIGVNWDSDDPINGPYDGEIQECPCCGGSGRAEDESFW